MGVAGCPGLCFWVLCCDVSLGSWVGWHSVTLGNIWKVQVNWKLIIPQLSTRKYINRLSQQNLFWGGGWSICKQPAQYLLYPTINLMIPYVSQKKENTMCLSKIIHPCCTASPRETLHVLFDAETPPAKDFLFPKPHLSRPKRLRWTIRHWGNDQRSNFLLWHRCSWMENASLRMDAKLCGFEVWKNRFFLVEMGYDSEPHIFQAITTISLAWPPSADFLMRIKNIIISNGKISIFR